jgi:hypothetical protein
MEKNLYKITYHRVIRRNPDGSVTTQVKTKKFKAYDDAHARDLARLMTKKHGGCILKIERR